MTRRARATETEWRIDEITNGVQIVAPVPPSANRWWRNWKGRMVLSTEARNYKVAIKALTTAWAARAGVAMQEGPIAIEIHWYRAIKKGDLDKRLGVMLDALQGSIYVNDDQIVRLLATRQDDKANPRVRVVVTALSPYR